MCYLVNASNLGLPKRISSIPFFHFFPLIISNLYSKFSQYGMNVYNQLPKDWIIFINVMANFVIE